MKMWNTFRKWAWPLLISAAAVLPLQALDFGISPRSGMMSNERSIQMMEDNLAQSNALLRLSDTLLAGTENIDPNKVNREYIQAMLRLSLDIGTMANRIVYTEELIGVMADRIVTVSNALLGNNQATQTNVLAAQKNLNTLLLGKRAQ